METNRDQQVEEARILRLALWELAKVRISEAKALDVVRAMAGAGV